MERDYMVSLQWIFGRTLHQNLSPRSGDTVWWQKAALSRTPLGFWGCVLVVTLHRDLPAGHLHCLLAYRYLRADELTCAAGGLLCRRGSM